MRIQFLHDIGHQDGIDYLVMECVEGETLAKRLEKGPMPVDQVLKLGAQIADARQIAPSGNRAPGFEAREHHADFNGSEAAGFGLAKPAAPRTSAATLTAASPKSPVTAAKAAEGRSNWKHWYNLVTGRFCWSRRLAS